MAAVPPATGLVLSGGGARAAYQAGALCAIAAILGKRRHHPFTVISGTSAGAINAATLAINATSYATGHAVTFFEATSKYAEWKRTRRRGERARLTIAHLMASTAIPFIFPATRIGEDFYMDGSVRQLTPLSPALHLGAQ